MKLSNIIGLSVLQFLALFFVVGYLLGILNIYFSDKNNYCEMTYMYEYPQFVRISVEGGSNYSFPQYGLYAYSEGRFTERARKMWFDGIPVLFLPGNAGSHMQVRSLASVALRKALSKGYDYHFDYFTISYNNEYSGIYGGVLESQTKFAAACITKILGLYKYTKSIPTSVIVIGHSMGGVIAKRLMTYSLDKTVVNIVITLAAPLAGPVINFDEYLNEYYLQLNTEWETHITGNKDVEDRKILISIGSGPRDVLVPAGMTASEKSYINALKSIVIKLRKNYFATIHNQKATAIPGVWVSPDHVSMVWCKQLVLVINRYLFDIIDPNTNQVTENRRLLESKARQYFQANRSMTLNPNITRHEVPMTADAFWYEDNRRIYQIIRPTVERQTYLMIRLVNFPQNRFVAIESINLDDKDWIFGCNAMYTSNTYRYCKQATSLSELSRWTGSAKDFGKRKLATIHLHSLKEKHPDWSHVIVKVSPTRKPIVLNVDINDHASREIRVALPSIFSFGKHVIIEETEPNSIYYELILPGFNTAHQAFLLHAEPTPSCAASQYHVSAEMHAPFAHNHQQFHYFTHLKRSPMKLRLFKSNPHITSDLQNSEHVKVTLLLDPQCTFKISISTSWYHRIAQFTRLYPSVLISYVAAIVVLAARTNILAFQKTGACVSIHTAIMSDFVSPLLALGLGKYGLLLFLKIPVLYHYLYETSGQNTELIHFMMSFLVLPAYLTALGITSVLAAAVLAVMVCSSQLVHRLFFRIMWRGGAGLAERVATELKRVPLLVSSVLLCMTPLSCGAASMVIGAAFYAFVISKMFEEYLEDYVYKLLARVASRVCRIFKSQKKVEKNKSKTCPEITQSPANEATISDLKTLDTKSKDTAVSDTNQCDTDITKSLIPVTDDKESSNSNENETQEKCVEPNKIEESSDIDDDLSTLNFHMTLFFLWMAVTILNLPALLTWARNFKYSMVLQNDKSYYPGVVLSVSSVFLFQLNGPRRNLRYYNYLTISLCIIASIIIIIGPLSLATVNYCVTMMLATITLQQVFDIGDDEDNKVDTEVQYLTEDACEVQSEKDATENKESEGTDKNCDTDGNEKDKDNENTQDGSEKDKKKCDECSENRIYNVFKNLREKFSFNDDV